jgi:hypothetical protein
MPSPRLSRFEVHPLVSFASPTEYVAACHLPSAREHQAPPLGFCFPFATSAYGVHLSPGLPNPTRFRPQRFSRSRRFAPPHATWACFIPQPRPGFALQGFSSLPSRLASSTSRSLLSLATVPYRQVALPAPGPPAPPPGRLSEQRSVVTCRWFRPTNHSIPS